MKAVDFSLRQGRFLGGFKSLNFVIISLGCWLVIYFLYAVLGYKLIQPYFDELEVLLRARGALLMIMVGAPLIAVFFILSYYVFFRWLFSSNKMSYTFKKAHLTLGYNSKSIIIERNRVYKSVLFVNKLDHSIRWLVVYQKLAPNCLIFHQLNATEFQRFIINYQDYFKLTEEKGHTFEASKKSLVYKKTFYHQ